MRGRCGRQMKTGWWCKRVPFHTGPCALIPRWWNIPGRFLHIKPNRWEC